MTLKRQRKNQAKIYDNGWDLKIIIPTKKSLLFRLLSLLPLGGWIGLFEVLHTGTNEGPILLILLLCILISLIVLLIALWNYFEKEIIEVTKDINGYGCLKIGRRFFMIGKTKKYFLSNIKRIRVTSSSDTPFYLENKSYLRET